MSYYPQHIRHIFDCQKKKKNIETKQNHAPAQNNIQVDVVCLPYLVTKSMSTINCVFIVRAREREKTIPLKLEANNSHKSMCKISYDFKLLVYDLDVVNLKQKQH